MGPFCPSGVHAQSARLALRLRRRALTGSATLPSLRDRLRRPFARWCGSATGEDHARHPRRSCPSLIRRLIVVAPLRLCLFRLDFAPIFCGGRNRPALLERRRLRRDGRSPPSAPAGGTGEKGKKGIAVLWVLPLVAETQDGSWSAGLLARSRCAADQSLLSQADGQGRLERRPDDV